MIPLKKNYSEHYKILKSEFPPKLIDLISAKEDIIVSSPIVSSPTTNPLLKHQSKNIRRFKSGKLRILYALSVESADLWGCEPSDPEIMFLYVGLRNNNTYDDAYKYLSSHW
ncbi:hypothetical protein ASN18_2060 [Candidatus Magnetominusculus xianensis]|uniref:Uncharacterized protein n=1 Tax=Candidatus Magnetominusculus xianensis TaxID=1748249 RepID=A0ABR5SE97_9BACT|nr:hypothetical protein ASN18_2060 [Candidatus Magnetominusculus xianensis]